MAHQSSKPPPWSGVTPRNSLDTSITINLDIVIKLSLIDSCLRAMKANTKSHVCLKKYFGIL